MQVLTEAEIDWINNYHKEVREKVSPRLEDKEVLQWLEDNTQPISVPVMVPAWENVSVYLNVKGSTSVP